MLWWTILIATYTIVGCSLVAHYQYDGGLKHDPSVSKSVEIFAHTAMIFLIIWLWLPVVVIAYLHWIIRPLIDSNWKPKE